MTFHHDAHILKETGPRAPSGPVLCTPGRGQATLSLAHYVIWLAKLRVMNLMQAEA